MVDYLAYYSPVLSKAVGICDKFIAFLKSEQAEEKDRFAKAAAETDIMRKGILERIANPKYLRPDEFSSVSGYMAFYDNQATNDYGVVLPAEKLIIRDKLMASWIDEVVEPLVKLMNGLEEKNSF